MRLKGKWTRLTENLSVYETRNHGWGHVEYRPENADKYQWRAYILLNPNTAAHYATEALAKRAVTAMLREHLTDLKELA